MPNRREGDPIGRHNFRVEVNGIGVAHFQEVGGLEVSTEVVEYRSGNELQIRKLPGRTSFSNVVLTRGLTTDEALWTWMETTARGQIDRRAGSIILLGGDGTTELSRFNFYEAWPCRWRSLELDARADEIAIEELELVVEGIERA